MFLLVWRSLKINTSASNTSACGETVGKMTFALPKRIAQRNWQNGFNDIDSKLYLNYIIFMYICLYFFVFFYVDSDCLRSLRQQKSSPYTAAKRTINNNR